MEENQKRNFDQIDNIDDSLNDYTELDTQTRSRKRLGSSGGHDEFPPDIATSGLMFITKTNNNKSSFIPSHKNYFGGMKISEIKVDTGCSSLMLYFEDAQTVHNILTLFPKDENGFSISESASHIGVAPVLIIQPINKTFDASLCQDLIPNQKPIQLNILRFGLCTEDMELLTSNPQLATVLDRLEQKTLRKFLAGGHKLARRTYALLGQTILGAFSCVRHSEIGFYVNSREHQLGDWNSIAKDEFAIKKHLSRIAEPFSSFDAREDEEDIAARDVHVVVDCIHIENK